MTFWNDPINFLAGWALGWLTRLGMPAGLGNLLLNLAGILIIIVLAMVLDIFLVWIERKVVARFQDRLGPNRIGPFGLFQPFADIIKLIIKENITPVGADAFLFNLAPVLGLASVIFLWAVIPFATKIYGVDLNVGLLYVVAAGAFGTLAIIMAGWASNNKYALLGALRMVAMMVSYEVPMIVALLVPTVLSGTMSLNGIVLAQSRVWYVFLAPLAMLIFLISVVAELGRAPFDLNEAESEIVAGFHIEYTGMKFGLFYAGELLHAFTFGGFLAILFFGGYGGFFGLENLAALTWLNNPFVQVPIFLAKAMVGYWIIMWIKYTMPRIRIDHMLAFSWKFLTPLSLAVLCITAVLDNLLVSTRYYVPGMFLGNVIVALITMEILRLIGRRQQKGKDASSHAILQVGP